MQVDAVNDSKTKDGQFFRFADVRASDSCSFHSHSESMGDSFRSSKEDARPPVPLRRLKSTGPGKFGINASHGLEFSGLFSLRLTWHAGVSSEKPQFTRAMLSCRFAICMVVSFRCLRLGSCDVAKATFANESGASDFFVSAY